jgi:hypothetical protein
VPAIQCSGASSNALRSASLVGPPTDNAQTAGMGRHGITADLPIETDRRLAEARIPPYGAYSAVLAAVRIVVSSPKAGAGLQSAATTGCLSGRTPLFQQICAVLKGY